MENGWALMMKCLTDPKNIKKKIDIRTMPVYGGDEFFDCLSSELLRLLKELGLKISIKILILILIGLTAGLLVRQ